MTGAVEAAAAFLDRGGPAMVAIAVLSVLALALILWKAGGFLMAGVWRQAPARAALAEWARHRDAEAQAAARGGVLAGFVAEAMAAARTLPASAARERAQAAALARLDALRAGARGLDLIATIAPLLGLLGTVLGMIAAFQALQEAGARPDPAALAGGIWEALLTTAAGMAVAIPATVAATWIDGVTDRMARAMEAAATAIFTRPDRGSLVRAA